MTEDHPGPAELAAYLDGGLSGAERVELEEHLSVCSACCHELIEVQRLRRQPVHRRPAWLAGTAAAAAVVVALLVGQPWAVLQEPGAGESASIERSSTVERPSVEAVTPTEGAVVSRAAIALVWRPAGSGSPLYEVSVTTVAGDSVWATSTRDTVQVLPADLLEPDQTYLWYVDALLRDGRPATTGVRHFRTGR